MKSYAREFQLYLFSLSRNEEYNEVKRACYNLLGHAVDLAPYGKDQLLRTLGSSKLLKERPLRKIAISNGILDEITYIYIYIFLKGRDIPIYNIP